MWTGYHISLSLLAHKVMPYFEFYWSRLSTRSWLMKVVKETVPLLKKMENIRGNWEEMGQIGKVKKPTRLGNSWGCGGTAWEGWILGEEAQQRFNAIGNI